MAEPGSSMRGAAAPAADDGRRSAANHSLTLERGLRVLRVLAEHPDGLSVSQLATALETHRAGIYRLLGPLLEQRFVRRTPDGRHILGVGLLELASAVQPRLLEIVLPELQRLADELRATTALTLRDEDEAVVAAVVEPRTTQAHIAYRRGLRHPLDVAASGLAILAAGPPLPGERPQVAEARRAGYAFTSNELFPGATGVATPIVAADGGHAAISAVWVEPRDAADAAAAVIRAAQAIAVALH